MELTVISQNMQDKALRIHSVSQARRELLEGCSFRSLGDTLRKFSGSEDPKKQLVDGLLQQHPDAKRDSLDRKVRNWLSGRTGSVDKEDAFSLCLILNLDLVRADEFLNAVTGEGIHWRSPNEIVWAYGIHNGYSYGQIQALQKAAAEMQKQAVMQNKRSTDNYTEAVSAKILPLLDLPETDLLAGLKACLPELGSYHNTAFSLFTQFLGLLENGGREGDSEETEDNKTSPEEEKRLKPQKISTQKILESYFYRTLIPVAKRNEKKSKDAFSDIQRSIRVNWPDEAVLSKMRNREMDVTRKVLILLFLATNGDETDYAEDEDFIEEVELTRDEMFENIYTRLNRMLKSCGFQLLDPRNPFDWLILCCISVEDICCIDHRMSHILSSIFPAVNETNEF